MAFDPNHPLSHALGAEIDALQAAASRSPGDGALQFALGQACLAAGRNEQAEQAFRRAARTLKDSPRPRLGAAAALLARGMRDAASEELRKVLRAFPSSADAWFNLGGLERAQRRYAEAARCYRRVLALRPGDEAAAVNLALSLIGAGDPAGAEAETNDFISGFGAGVDLLLNLGQALRQQRRFEAAAEAFRRALSLSPGHPGATLNLAIVLDEAGQTDRAEAMLRALVKTDPGSWGAHFHLATLLLARGEYREGWREYLWREAHRAQRERRGTNGAADLGLPSLLTLKGRTVVVAGEQGLGDTLFFLRFLDPVAAQAAAVFLDVDPRLDEVIGYRGTHGGSPDNEPIILPAGNLPYLTGADVAPPLPLDVDEATRARLRARLERAGAPPYLGVTWEAGTPPGDGVSVAASLHKRIDPRRLGAMIRAFSGTVISLQRHPRREDLDAFGRMLGRPAHDFGDANARLPDALAVLSLLDRYVGVSNTNMHLLAGIGKAADVLVTIPPEWRWMREGDRSPWFPGFRLHRQRPDLSWDEAAAGLAASLARDAP